MRYPLDSIYVTQAFGADPAYYSQYGLKGHHGVDLRARDPLPVYAVEDARVLRSANGVTDQFTGAFVSGEVIVLIGASGEYWHLHLSKREVSAGQTVKQGQRIGYTGATGATTQPHLHFGVRPLAPNTGNGYRGFIDPMAFIKAREEEPMTAEQQAAYVKGKLLGSMVKLTEGVILMRANLDATHVWKLETAPTYESARSYVKGKTFEVVSYIDTNGTRYYLSESDALNGRPWGVNSKDCSIVAALEPR